MAMHTMLVKLSCWAYLLLFCYTSSALAGDLDLLISFKTSLPNPNTLSNWNRRRNVCKFDGVTCKGGRVSSLTIGGLQLGANFSLVSARILSLPYLQKLSLHSTNLTGNISALPPKCSRRLTELNLSGNNLRGSVFDAASLAASCPSLQLLNLSNNHIGQISNHSTPAVISQLKTLDLSYNLISSNRDLQLLFSVFGVLTHLDLSNNNIQGTMPQFTDCIFLQYLDISSNKLSGTVPAGTFSNCLDLNYLNLSSNHFTGKAPPDIERWTGLHTLSLSKNNFSSEFPVMSLVVKSKLQFLELAFNNFNSSLPKSISNLTTLELLDLSANNFSGFIPHSLCTENVSKLKRLYLQDYYFTGTIPDSLSNCTDLVSLDLSLNLFYGSIPGTLGSLSNLKDLIMWQNNLNDELPAQFSSLRSHRNLLLDYNSLTGTIPDGLANCTSLNWLSLASNQLSGSIPIWTSKLEKLVVLILANNSFIGPLPAALGDCKDLTYLDLSSNKLNGSIPPALKKLSGKMGANPLVRNWLYIYAMIEDNSQCHRRHISLEFDGIRYNDWMCIPDICGCNYVHTFLLFTGAYTTNSTAPIHLDLSYNQLNGCIPTEIASMQNLVILFLEHNYLSGQLPQELGGLKYLTFLDLSHNMLEGTIPSSLSYLSLSGLDLSNNQLSGTKPEQGSLITYPKSAFENNSGLCGLPLPPCSSRTTSEVDGSLFLQKTKHQDSRARQIAFVISFCIFFITSFVLGQFL